MPFKSDNSNTPELLLLIKEAAETLGLPYWKLNRAVRQNLVPSYTLLNSRRYVRVSEVLACISGHDAATGTTHKSALQPAAPNAQGHADTLR